MDALLQFVKTANGYLADYILIVLLVGVGLFFTISTRFVQVRCFGEGMKRVFGGIKLFGGKNDKGGLSSFQALATAIAAQVGTGNIVGASGAILTGGPGAIFWMWIIAFLGMATIYAEATLAQETRVVEANGEVHGGPVYYIKKAFTGGFGKFLAAFFSIATILALGFMGSMVQSNSIAESICNAVNVDYTSWGWIIGLVLAIVCAIIFIGGIQRIASVAEKIVPTMACLFLLGGLIILVANITKVPQTFAMIFKYAFTPNALIGGGIGYALKIAISQGAKRGLFSNEAGMGSTPHAHAQANVEKPHDQGVVAMIGVFIDTFVVLTMTALVVITCLYSGNGVLAETVDEQNKEEIRLNVEYYDEAGNITSTKKVITNEYLLRTGQSDNNVVAELILADKRDVNTEVKKNKNDIDLVALIENKTIVLENKTVEELYAKYPMLFFADETTYNSIISKDNTDKKLSIADVITVMKANKSIENIAVVSKTTAMQQAASSVFGNIGNIFVAICLMFFAFTTIIGWNFFGKINIQYLFKNSKVAVLIYSVIAIAFIFFGTLASNDLVWELTDFFNYLMVLPNAVALFCLYKLVVKNSKSNKK